MERIQTMRTALPEMHHKPHTVSFLARRSWAPRPASTSTEIFDTDLEDDDYDDSDSPSSLDSASTLSSLDEATTPPHTSGLRGFEFHFDDRAVAGPYGPHLFTAESKSDYPQATVQLSPVFAAPKPPARNISYLNRAVAELDQTQVRGWTTTQVADWMAGAGFESSVVDKFLLHDICGAVLLDLQFEDLKELDISSFGKRYQLMTHIESLRNSTLVAASPTARSPLSPIQRRPSQISRTGSHRRGRFAQLSTDDITPAESASIVAIEQVLPKPHQCSKGEDCPKWRKQQRKIQRLEEQFNADMKSMVAPSTVASSDVLGAVPPFAISPERLGTVQPRDPVENVRNFLKFQHVNSPVVDQFAQNLHDLPRLTIPTDGKATESPYHTPFSAFRHPTEQQARLRADLVNDPYHYGGVASPVDVYRTGTPMSMTDLPVTALPVDPCNREVSHSVPPNMKYGGITSPMADPIVRSQSSQPWQRPHRPSFVPHMAALDETLSLPKTPRPRPITSEVDLVNHSGWMRKRQPTRLMKHEWQDQYFTLQGTQLSVANDQDSDAFQHINVDDYILHAYTTASGSKLSAAFKKGMGVSSGEPAFAFSLIPEDQKQKKLFEKDRSHHFAVNSGNSRVEWMRKLMLAKALKKTDGGQL